MSTIAIYRTKPQEEHKALEDCRRARIKAALPRSKLRKPAFGRKSSPLAAGYVYAEGKPADTPHMRSMLGTVSRSEVAKLWKHCRIRTIPRAENPYKPGDAVIMPKGKLADVRATVTETRGRTCIVAFQMLGKTHTQAIAYAQLRPG